MRNCLLFVQFEDRHKRLGGQLNTAQAPHLLLALLLFFQQLFLSCDVAAVALGQHVLAHGPDSFTGDDLAADGGLNGHLKELAGDVVLELFTDAPGPLVGLFLVGDEGQGVHLFAVEEQVHLHEFAGAVALDLIVQRGISLGVGLEGVEKVVDDLVEGHGVVEFHQIGVQILHILELGPALLAHGHDIAHIVGAR